MPTLLMSPAEVREWDRRVRAFYRSRSLVRNVAAILMDTGIGASGENEETALTKAEAVIDHLRKRELLKTNHSAP